MKKRTFLIITIIILILSTSCKNKLNKESMKLEQKEKGPNSLITVMEKLDEVLVSMNEIEEISKSSQLEFEIYQTKTGNNEDKTKKDEKDKASEFLTKEEKIIKEWKNVDDNIEEIHKNWNDYEVDSMRKGSNIEKGKKLKKNLNLLTIAVENKKTSEVIDMGSKVQVSLAPFFDLYKDEINGDLSRIKYAVHQAYLNGESGNIENGDKLLSSTEEYITGIRQKLDKDKTKIEALDRLSLSISDMQQSLKENSLKLLGIKRDIILKNIKSLEK